ncbi:aldehyde dehydrogenase family protein [Salibacteraceae bacterium]|nr:aldehyde dehydrogenase [Crocinitomicaceae bacterium]MCH9821741.1 aldehyde dehydrogenase family protein [Bacteroidota bacterium]MDA9938313.1 aldehyde dehydrogenase family protein [Salibacteraceae bacterium]MDC1204207.1 aldehyde dehydrogenase family protein [Salibacteraceae bacterium]|tara:strand:+ start:42871 stop:44256 length:1386 start_codon:yes stop_codon:yes gene_type:complete
MLKVYSPYTLEQIGEYPLIPMESIDGIIQTAYDLFEDRSKWLKPHQRKTILQRCAKIMETQIEELTKIAVNEGGKPYTDSKVEVLRAINGVEIAAENIGELKGGEVPMGLTPASEGRIAFTQREPIGVVASVSAFNHPLNLIVHQVITAVAAGCPVIVKPAPTTPMSCEALIDILKEAGLPKGWCQMVICENDVAERLITDNRINYFSFIGSAKVGWYLRSKLSPGTRCALEHGGAAPVIVEPDANFEEMLPSLIKGGFYHAGQVCVSVQRVFAHESICKELSEEIAAGAKKLKVGDPMYAATEVGPLILPREVDRVEDWVNEAVEAGAELLCGGKRISNTCFEPTVLLNPPANARVSTTEIFGPVVCIYSYSDRAEAIKIANSLDVHFQASIFTKNIDVALEAVQKLNATAVMVNDHTAFRVDWMPFGGRDASGIGMGGIQYSMHEMTREKLMVFKSNLL